jgi:phosphoglycolate phosphatase
MADSRGTATTRRRLGTPRQSRLQPNIHMPAKVMAVRQILFFDIDGTMLSTGGAGQRAMELALVEEFRIRFPFEGVLTAGRTDRGIADEIFARYKLVDSPAERERFMRSYLERLPDCLQTLPGELLPGVKDLLHHFQHDVSVHLSLLTGNYVEGAWIKLRHFGIDHFFETGGFGDDHAHRNDVARLALDNVRLHLKYHVPDRAACVIGDTPADISCARSVNARAVAVATGMYSFAELQTHQPDHLFADLSDTTTVAQSLLQA